MFSVGLGQKLLSLRAVFLGRFSIVCTYRARLGPSADDTTLMMARALDECQMFAEATKTDCAISFGNQSQALSLEYQCTVPSTESHSSRITRLGKRSDPRPIFSLCYCLCVQALFAGPFTMRPSLINFCRLPSEKKPSIGSEAAKQADREREKVLMRDEKKPLKRHTKSKSIKSGFPRASDSREFFFAAVNSSGNLNTC